MGIYGELSGDKMKSFIELRNEAKKFVRVDYRCEDCIYYKQVAKPFENTQRFYYYHVCSLHFIEVTYESIVCNEFEPNKDIRLKYIFDVQGKLQELMYEEMWDKFHEELTKGR